MTARVNCQTCASGHLGPSGRLADLPAKCSCTSAPRRGTGPGTQFLCQLSTASQQTQNVVASHSNNFLFVIILWAFWGQRMVAVSWQVS